jgi:glutathione S-transferase
MTAVPTLYSSIPCNFCQRVKITLDAKHIAFQTVEIDLIRRPAWFTEKASRGIVPLLECDEGSFYTSAAVNEYINERWPEPPMLPDVPAERVVARMFIDWWNRKGPTAHYEERLMNVRPEREKALEERLTRSLEECEQRLAELGYSDGYWNGQALSLVDAAAAAVFVRFTGLRHFHGFEIPETLGRVRAWHDALLSDPHVQATAPDEGTLLSLLTDFRKVLKKAADAGIDVPVSGGAD